MKTKLVLGSLLAFTSIINAQNEWAGAGSNNTTGSIYRSGNVGIGNTAPGYLLHVSTTGVTPFYVERTSGSGQINGLKMFFTSNPATGIVVGGGSTIFQNQASGSDLFFMPTPTTAGMIIKSQGNVGIGTVSPAGKLHVSDDATYMTNNQQFSNGPYIEPNYAASYHAMLNTTKQGWHTALEGYDLNNEPGTVVSPWGAPANNGIGVFGKAQRTQTYQGFSFCIGVYGKGLGAGFNIGGVFYGDSQEEIGERQEAGSTNTPKNTGTKNYGIWSSSSNGAAAYFNGSAYSTGNYQTSDSELKSDVKPLVNAVDKLSLLKPNYFTYKTDEHKSMNLPAGQQMGLNAQDIEKDFPELVKDVQDLSGYLETGNSEGIKTYKAVNYTSLIPLLIASIQEQQVQIKEQTKTNEELKNLVAVQQQQINDMQGKSSGANGIGALGGQMDSFSMDQNVPNPFSNETVIRYTMPQSVGSAYMAVYDLSGKQINSFPLNQKGSASITINSEKLAAGIYIYSIVADGKVMDSKRMVIAEKH